MNKTMKLMMIAMMVSGCSRAFTAGDGSGELTLDNVSCAGVGHGYNDWTYDVGGGMACASLPAFTVALGFVPAEFSKCVPCILTATDTDQCVIDLGTGKGVFSYNPTSDTISYNFAYGGHPGLACK